MKRTELGTPYLAGLSLLSGVLLSLSYSLYPVWWVAWIAPAPAIAALLLAPLRLRRKLGLAAGTVAGVTSFTYHLTVGGWPAAIVILVVVAVAWASVLRSTAATIERRSALVAVWIIPVTWAAIDTLMIHLSPHGSAGSFAYSQMDFLPVIQIASLGGVPAISFVTLLAGSYAGLALARALGAPVRGLRAAGALTSAVIVCALLFGSVRLSTVPTGNKVSVAMLASDGVSERPHDLVGFWTVYGSAIERAAAQGKVVLLPEAVLDLRAGDAENAAKALASFARARAATIVAGVVVTDSARVTNRALVAQADGRHAWYVKQHLVPGFEAGMSPGDRPLLLGAPLSDVGVAICKDMHFPTLGREYSVAGARLMLVLANDFEVDDWMTARMTALRGVESGYSVARAARHGINFASDPYGRILVERRSGRALSTLTGTVPSGLSEPTTYSRIGDLFGWLCVAGLGALILARILKPQPQPPTSVPA
jgi:apolipoprotein N-acyltransferase